MWGDNSCSTNFGRVIALDIFTHFSLSSQLLLHPCMDLNETWQGSYTTSLEVHVGRYSCSANFDRVMALTLKIFTHFSLSSQLLLHPCMNLNETWHGCCTTNLELHVGRYSCSANFGRVMALDIYNFLHILAFLFNSSYILAWIWMKLGRDVAPQV